MTTKKIVILIITIFLLAAAGVAVFLWKNNKLPENIIPGIKTQEISVLDKKIEDNTKPFKIEITYPEIAGQNEFNNLAKNIIDTEISNFKSNSLANDQAVKETDLKSYEAYPREYDLIINYDKGQINNDMASVVFDIYNFEGGAHGASYQKALNYDFKNKKEILLADIFSGQNDYLQKISDYCIEDLTKQIGKSAGEENVEMTNLNEGAGPMADNFTIFLINKDSITFYFPQYQVAAGYLGGFKVTMPYIKSF